MQSKGGKNVLSGGGGGQLFQKNVMIPCRTNFQIWQFSDDVGGTPGFRSLKQHGKYMPQRGPESSPQRDPKTFI